MSRRETQWVAHVSLKEENGIQEVQVMAKKGKRFEAMTKVYAALRLSGPNDARISNIKLVEVETNEVYVIGKGPHPVDTPKVDKSNWKRYRVTLYPTRMSKDPKILTMRSDSAYDALHSMMAMHKVPRPDVVGPYLVEELTPEGDVTRMVNQASAFGKQRVDNLKPRQPVSLELVPVDEEDRNCCPTVTQCTEERRCINHDKFDRKPTTSIKEEALVSKVLNILDAEKKIAMTKLKVVKD